MLPALREFFYCIRFSRPVKGIDADGKMSNNCCIKFSGGSLA